MKKFFALALAILMVLGMVACGAPAQNALRMTPATEEPSADLLLNNI